MTSLYASIFPLFVQFTERALAHHLLDDYGGPSAQYHIALARLKLQKRILEEAEESLKEALQFDHQVYPIVKVSQKKKVIQTSFNCQTIPYNLFKYFNYILIES